MTNNSIRTIDRTLSSATTPIKSEPGSDGNEEVLCIHQNSWSTGTSPLVCLVPYPGHTLEEGLMPQQRSPYIL